MDIREIVNYSGFIIGILGIALSYFLYKKGLDTKDPRCFYKTFKNIYKLSDEKDTKIRIFYDQDEVSRVFTTYVWIWNNGKKPINKTDIPLQSSIKINLRDEKYPPEILDYKIIKISRPAINFSVNHSGNTALEISFDFLDKDDGVVLEVQHTGSGGTKLETEGIILGAPEGFKLIGTTKKNPFLIRALQSAFSLISPQTHPKIYFAVGFSVVVILLIFAGLNYSDVINIKYEENPILIYPSLLRKALITELPQVTEQNISNIVSKAKPMEVYSGNGIFYFFQVAIPLFFLGILVLALRKYTVVPYPKVIKLDKNFSKFEDE